MSTDTTTETEPARTGTKFPGLFAALAEPFHGDEVKVLQKGKSQLRYITARTAMNRLDAVLGPENWEDDYSPFGGQGVKCTLRVTLPDGSQVVKTGVGGVTAMNDASDTDKTGESDALKRAAVKFGVGRYLYRDGVPEYDTSHRAENLNNRTGHGRTGAYAPPEQVKTWEQWKRDFVAGCNQRWLDSITGPDGSIPAGARDELVSSWQVSGHALKWARGKGLVEAPADARPAQVDKLVAVVWAKDRAALTEELKRYVVEKRDEARAGLAPEADGDPDIDYPEPGAGG